MTGWYRWGGKHVPPIAKAPKVKPPIVSPKNKDYQHPCKAYQDTADELERIYQEVKAEAGRRSPILPLYVSEPEGPPKKPGELREFLIIQPPWTEPPVPVLPVPAGVTLDELFEEDEND